MSAGARNPRRAAPRFVSVPIIVPLLAAPLLLTLACSPAAPSTAATTPASTQQPTSASASPSPSAPAPVYLAPLTHLPTSAAVLTRPAVAVAVDGNPVGLAQADIVYEEISDTLRWVAVYQSTDATVGPVAPTRPADHLLVGVLGPIYAFDGGPKGFVAQDKTGDVVPLDATATPSAFVTTGGRLTVSTASARVGRTAAKPAPVLPFAGPLTPQLAAHVTKRKVTLVVPGAATQTWAFDAATHLWTRSTGGPKVSVANLVVQSVAYKSVQLKHPDGPFVPSARVTGLGHSWVFAGSDMVSGIWRKSGKASVTNYGDNHGVPARFTAGRTWVVLLPPGSRVVA